MKYLLEVLVHGMKNLLESYAFLLAGLVDELQEHVLFMLCFLYLPLDLFDSFFELVELVDGHHVHGLEFPHLPLGILQFSLQILKGLQFAFDDDADCVIFCLEFPVFFFHLGNLELGILDEFPKGVFLRDLALDGVVEVTFSLDEDVLFITEGFQFL